MTEIEKAQELCEAWGMQDNNGYSVKDTFKTGFTQGARWQAKQSPWISVEDRLPDVGVKVFTKTKNGNYILTSMYIPADCKGNVLGPKEWRGSGAFKGSITHWMPIPE